MPNAEISLYTFPLIVGTFYSYQPIENPTADDDKHCYCAEKYGN